MTISKRYLLSEVSLVCLSLNIRNALKIKCDCMFQIIISVNYVLQIMRALSLLTSISLERRLWVVHLIFSSFNHPCYIYWSHPIFNYINCHGEEYCPGRKVGSEQIAHYKAIKGSRSQPFYPLKLWIKTLQTYFTIKDHHISNIPF